MHGVGDHGTQSVRACLGGRSGPRAFPQSRCVPAAGQFRRRIGQDVLVPDHVVRHPRLPLPLRGGLDSRDHQGLGQAMPPLSLPGVWQKWAVWMGRLSSGGAPVKAGPGQPRWSRWPAASSYASCPFPARFAKCALCANLLWGARVAHGGGGDSCLQIRGMPGFGSDVGSHSSPAVMRGGCGASTTPTACSNPASWRRRAPRRHARAGARSDKGSQRRNHIESREARSHEDAGRAVT